MRIVLLGRNGDLSTEAPSTDSGLCFVLDETHVRSTSTRKSTSTIFIFSGQPSDIECVISSTKFVMNHLAKKTQRNRTVMDTYFCEQHDHLEYSAREQLQHER